MQTEIQKDEYGKAIPNEYHELLATWNVTDVSHTTATAWNKHMRQGLIDDYATIAVFEISNEKRNESLPIESLSCAFAIAAILAALGQFSNGSIAGLIACSIAGLIACSIAGLIACSTVGPISGSIASLIAGWLS